MKQTDFMNLKLPEDMDVALRQALNDNFEAIATSFYNILVGGGESKES